MKKKELIGCIADDFTGAADVCSLLVNSGARCIFLNDILDYEIDVDNVDVVVIALKIRNIKSVIAVDKFKEALNYLESLNVSRIFSKYCSTFDSTSDGNIGPILDYLMERYELNYTVASPAFPDTNRDVFNGYLFADGKLLSEGSMRTHPITPMLDSNLIRLLEKQSKYKAINISHKVLYQEGNIKEYLENIFKNRNKFYIIPDYFNNNHGRILMDYFGDIKVLSGSSKFIADWYNYIFSRQEKYVYDKLNNKESKVIIFAGSLSDKTNEQINYFINEGGIGIEITTNDLKKGSEYYEDLILNTEENLMFYTSRKKLEKNNENSFSYEKFFAELAQFSYKNGIKKIISAGGETSGAIIKSLPFKEYKAIYSIDVGVPVLEPLEYHDFQVVLKSGNFGSIEFFDKSIKLMNNIK